ncbi:hypothetical protein LXJ56_26280, partial [Escherichia coli]|nr:hypothetical protein [Escherichia coli]
PADHVPSRPFPFIWFYVRQAKAAFFAVLVLGGLVALTEAGLFWFLGGLVDILASVNPAKGWQGLMQDHGTPLLLMLAGVLIARTIILTL